METEEPSIQVPEDTDRTDPNERPKAPSKPLFKMKIGDLQSLEHDPDSDCFKFKNHDLSLVVCGGKITDIFRDDYLFSFEMDDGSGKISCFHRFKYDREYLTTSLCELPTPAQFLQTSIAANQTRLNDETVFGAANENTVVRNLEDETGDAVREILSWFQEEIVEKTKSPCIGDFIHVKGYLTYGDGIRKIHVQDFRIATHDEHEDLAQEINYLNQCVY